MVESGLPTRRPGRVLIVDDQLMNRELLRGILEPLGHEIEVAGDGDTAIKLTTDWKPDVVLLDVMMPGTDGYEVCRQLKQDPLTEHLPVIMVTALAGRDDRLKGIRAGANDFLTKPLDIADATLRVQNAIRLKWMFDELANRAEKIRSLEELRENLTNMMVHDLRSPLMGILGNLELAIDDPDEVMPEGLVPMVNEAVAATRKLVEMVSSILDVARLEEGKLNLDIRQSNLADLARGAISLLGTPVEGRSIRVEEPDHESPVTVACDAALVARVFMNLLGNALKFTRRKSQIRVTVRSEDGGGARVSVTDQGQGIAPEFHEKIFQKFGQVEQYQQRRGYSTGLGLTFCRLAIEAHGGRIGLESEMGVGSSFWFVLPGVPDQSVSKSEEAAPPTAT